MLDLWPNRVGLYAIFLREQGFDLPAEDRQRLMNGSPACRVVDDVITVCDDVSHSGDARNLCNLAGDLRVSALEAIHCLTDDRQVPLDELAHAAVAQEVVISGTGGVFGYEPGGIPDIDQNAQGFRPHRVAA